METTSSNFPHVPTTSPPPPATPTEPKKGTPHVVVGSVIAILVLGCFYLYFTQLKPTAPTHAAEGLHKDLEAIAFLASYGGSEKVKWVNVDENTIKEVHGAAFVWRSKTNHCFFRFQTMRPPYYGEQFDFSKLGRHYKIVPDPIGENRMRLSVEGLPGAHCGRNNAIPEPTKTAHSITFRETILSGPCDSAADGYSYDIDIFNAQELERFKEAIEFIKNNFCPSIPGKPY